ncbi:MAG: hypothetical protein JJT94_13130 [Bernardetiaceae bacterium]|nr:hypothetical protein [Bernardetiaceae bacterium]
MTNKATNKTNNMNTVDINLDARFVFPKYASGLRQQNTDKQLTFAVFRMLCENLALQHSDFSCRDFAPDTPDLSFYGALFRQADVQASYWLLASKYSNFWASAASDGSLPDFEHTFFRFLDLPILTCALQSVIVLPASFLNRRIDSEDAVSNAAVQYLSDEEFAFFSHYQPERLGDVLFHAWI